MFGMYLYLRIPPSPVVLFYWYNTPRSINSLSEILNWCNRHGEVASSQGSRGCATREFRGLRLHRAVPGFAQTVASYEAGSAAAFQGYVRQDCACGSEVASAFASGV